MPIVRAPQANRWLTRLQHRIADLRTVCAFSLCPLDSVSSAVDASNGKHLSIEQWTSLGSGGFVWGGARRLALASSAIMKRPSWQGLNVIELGAGTGALGLAISTLGANVTLTDQASFVFPGGDAEGLEARSLLDLLRLNAKQNAHHAKERVQVREMLWGDEPSMLAGLPHAKYDVIVASDVLLFVGAQRDLLRTLRHLSNDKTTILIEHTDRSSEDGEKFPDDLLRFLDLLDKDAKVPWYPKIVADHGRHITLSIERGPSR